MSEDARPAPRPPFSSLRVRLAGRPADASLHEDAPSHLDEALRQWLADAEDIDLDGHKWRFVLVDKDGADSIDPLVGMFVCGTGRCPATAAVRPAATRACSSSSQSVKFGGGPGRSPRMTGASEACATICTSPQELISCADPVWSSWKCVSITRSRSSGARPIWSSAAAIIGPEPASPVSISVVESLSCHR